MKALSIQQPWAWAILHAGKDVENRTWPTHFRGRFQIHAGKKVDTEGVAWLRSRGHDVPADLPTGAYLGEATLTGCYELADHAGATDTPPPQWGFGPYCFALRDARPYGEPIPGRGALGFFESGHAGSYIE